jgi:hypothetical protein
MSDAAAVLLLLWHKSGWPLCKLLLIISVSLLLACFIESMNWTRRLSAAAAPVVRFARLSDTSGAAFSLAFFSGVAANTMLAEAYEKQQISRKELLLSNIFNSLPAYFLHLPTTFFIAFPLIKGAAFIYVSLTAGAAFLRTAGVSLLSRFLLSSKQAQGMAPEQGEAAGWRAAWERAVQRFRKRIRKIILFTAPIYVLFFALTEAGFFQMLEQFMAAHLGFLAWLSPKAVSIIALQIMAEFTAGLGAAGALLQDGSMEARQVILALLIGNILSSPIRAVRHQFPYYAGIFQPRTALLLIACSQGVRAASLVFTALLYWFFSFVS